MKATTFCNNATLAMKSGNAIGQRTVMLFALLTLLGLCVPAVFAQSASDLKGSGSIHFAPVGISTFALSGIEAHLNEYACRGELQFTPSSRHDGALDGYGVAVFRASNEDQLVGIVTLKTDASGTGQIVFAWRDAVRFSDGTIATSTGRFQESLPADAKTTVKTGHTVVIAIIAILIG